MTGVGRVNFLLVLEAEQGLVEQKAAPAVAPVFMFPHIASLSTDCVRHVVI